MLLKASQAIEHEAGEGLDGGLVDQSSEVGDNEAYLHKNLESKSSEDDWLDEGSECEDYDTEAAMYCYPKKSLFEFSKVKF